MRLKTLKLYAEKFKPFKQKSGVLDYENNIFFGDNKIYMYHDDDIMVVNVEHNIPKCLVSYKELMKKISIIRNDVELTWTFNEYDNIIFDVGGNITIMGVPADNEKDFESTDNVLIDSLSKEMIRFALLCSKFTSNNTNEPISDAYCCGKYIIGTDRKSLLYREKRETSRPYPLRKHCLDVLKDYPSVQVFRNDKYTILSVDSVLSNGRVSVYERNAYSDDKFHNVDNINKGDMFVRVVFDKDEILRVLTILVEKADHFVKMNLEDKTIVRDNEHSATIEFDTIDGEIDTIIGFHPWDFMKYLKLIKESTVRMYFYRRNRDASSGVCIINNNFITAIKLYNDETDNDF